MLSSWRMLTLYVCVGDVGASTSLYVYLYAIYYFFTKTRMSGMMQVRMMHVGVYSYTYDSVYDDA